MPNHIKESIFDDSEGLIYPSHDEWSYANQYFAEHGSALKLSRKRQGQGKVRMSFWNLNGVVYAATHPSGKNIERCFIYGKVWKSTLKLVVRQDGKDELLTLQDRLKVLKIRAIPMGKSKKMTVHNFKKKLEQVIILARDHYLDDFKKSRDLHFLEYPNDNEDISNFVRSTTIAAHGLSDVIAVYEDKALLDTANYHYALKNYMLLQRYEKDLYTAISSREVSGLYEKLILAVQIALQLHYLHSGIMSSSGKRYAHLDFHTKNIMFDSHGGIRLIDFEHSKAFTDETLTSDYYCDLNVCAIDYLSSSESDNCHLVYRDIFSLLRVINMPYHDSLSLFSYKDLINIFGYNIFDNYLTTEHGYLKPQQHTSALIVAARLLFHGYFKPGSYLAKSVKNHSTIHDSESDAHIKKLESIKTHVTCHMIVSALDSAYKYTNDVVKKSFIRTMKQTLNKSKDDINDVFLRNTLLIITRILSHHRCCMKGRATMQLGITSAPTAYLKAEDSLKEAAKLLGCRDAVKHCLYADSDEWGTNLTSDQSGKSNEMSYSLFSAKYTQQQRSSTSKGFWIDFRLLGR
jgi:hypothetical protein